MKRFNKKSALEEPLINLTPLIDVVFVVLIMFIVVAPLLNTDKVELAESSRESTVKKGETPKASMITVTVTKDNVVLVNNQQIAISDLKGALLQLKKKYPESKLQLFHDRNGSFGTYQKIKNAGEEVGFQEMDVILK